jgi:hypothetical protein
MPKVLGLFFVVTFGSCLDVAAIQARGAALSFVVRPPGHNPQLHKTCPAPGAAALAFRPLLEP